MRLPEKMELVANEMYDKLTILLNNTRKKIGIQKGRPIDPLRKYDNLSYQTMEN